MRLAKLLAILLIVGIALFGVSNALTLAPATVAGVWPIRAGPVSLSVNAQSSSAILASAIDYDPDGPLTLQTAPGSVMWEGLTPTVHFGVGSLRAVREPPTLAGDYYAYLYEVDIDFKTLAHHYGSVYFESRAAACTGYFAIVIDTGAAGVGANTSAIISDVWITSYRSGVAKNPGASWQEVKAAYDASSFPEENVIPNVVTSTQAGEPLITEGAGTAAVTCRVALTLYPGGLYEWGYVLIFPVGKNVYVDDVYATYTCRVEVLVPKGEAPPFANPLLILLQMLQDFGFWVRDSWARLSDALGLWLWVLLGVLVLFLFCFVRPILTSYLGGHKSKSRKGR
jgi:hypothetical protein